VAPEVGTGFMYPKQTYFSLVPTKKNLHKDELLHPREKSLTGAGRQEMSMLGGVYHD